MNLPSVLVPRSSHPKVDFDTECYDLLDVVKSEGRDYSPKRENRMGNALRVSVFCGFIRNTGGEMKTRKKIAESQNGEGYVDVS